MSIQVTRKQVDDKLVASIHFLGQYADIPAQFARLYEQAGPYVVGEPICLYDRAAEENPQEIHDIGVCYPVSQPVEAGEVKSWILPGVEVISATQAEAPDAAWGPAEWWRELGAYAREHQMAIAEDPLREIHRGDGSIELQAVSLWPRWLGNLAAGVERYTDRSVQQQVMAGSADLPADSPIQERLAWVQGAMERLDGAVEDPEARGHILNGCAHRFPLKRIEKMRAEYERLQDIDALLEIMRADRSAGGQSWYASPVREGNVIYETKNPADPQGYREAQDEVEKRARYCFCPVIRAAIRAGEPISPTYCHCGAGWFVQLWGGILQQPVRVEIVESVLQGDDRCRFAVHLPL